MTKPDTTCILIPAGTKVARLFNGPVKGQISGEQVELLRDVLVDATRVEDGCWAYVVGQQAYLCAGGLAVTVTPEDDGERPVAIVSFIARNREELDRMILRHQRRRALIERACKTDAERRGWLWRSDELTAWAAEQGAAVEPTNGSLYRSAVAADSHYSSELKAAFGRSAGDRRYDFDESLHPERCRRASEAFRLASAAWRERQEALRPLIAVFSA